MPTDYEEFPDGTRDDLFPGAEFGRWTVLGFGGYKLFPNARRRILAVCECECGTITTVDVAGLRSGRSNSCGCLRAEVTGDLMRTHGGSKKKWYVNWLCMNSRCTTDRRLKNRTYFERGISVCEGLKSPVTFFESLGDRPFDRATVDRINNNGIYSCGKCRECKSRKLKKNVRWASSATQSRNTRRNINVTVDGRVLCLKDACNLQGLDYGTVRSRIKSGVCMERALELI